MDLSKYILRTERDQVSWDLNKRQESCDWSAEEFKFIQDKEDYNTCSQQVKIVLKKIFAFFLIGDGIISEDLIPMITEAMKEENWPKVFFLCMQLKVENTHAETYSKAALTIVPEDEHEAMLKMCSTVVCIVKKGEWISKNVDSQDGKGLKNVCCALGEGVGFVSLFSIVFYLRKLNKFKDFVESNEQISKDESIHRDEKASEAKRSLTPDEYDEARRLIKEFVEIEKLHADYLLEEPIISRQVDIDAGLTHENLYTYIEMLADQVSVLCGLGKVYDVHVNLRWMEDINLSQKSNFYERNVVGSYRRFNTNESMTQQELEDPTEVDF